MIVTAVLFLFPPSVPATGSSMNYAVVALAILFLLCFSQWFAKGRHHFEGPQVHSAGVLASERAHEPAAEPDPGDKLTEDKFAATPT